MGRRKKRNKNNLPAVMGRPKVEIEADQLDILLKYGAMLHDAAAYLEVSESSLSRYIKKNYGCTFEDYRATQIAKMKYSLINKISRVVHNELDERKKMNTQLVIFAAKNLCGWKDRTETIGEQIVSFNQMPTVMLSFSDEKVVNLSQQKIAEKTQTIDIEALPDAD